jgi:hypothetical protein
MTPHVQPARRRRLRISKKDAASLVLATLVTGLVVVAVAAAVLLFVLFVLATRAMD